MKNQFILTPFFIDEEWPELLDLRKEGWLVNQLDLPEGDPQDRMSLLHEPLAAHVHETAVSGDLPVSIAGDCCTTIGVLAGLQRAKIDPTLIWFDAHGDFNTWETTTSGFLGGMPLAMLVGRGEQKMPKAVGLHPLGERKVIFTDGRDLDPEEEIALKKSQVRHVPDVRWLINEDLPDGPLYVHVDVDVLNPQSAAAMNYLSQGGPTAADLGQVFQFLARTGRVVAVSVSSWNPRMDPDGKSRSVCMGLVDILVSEGLGL
jgi:arginase